MLRVVVLPELCVRQGSALRLSRLPLLAGGQRGGSVVGTRRARLDSARSSDLVPMIICVQAGLRRHSLGSLIGAAGTWPRCREPVKQWTP